MSARIESGVEKRIENPTPGESVDLIVGVDSLDSSTLNAISSTGATVKDELPSDYISISIEEQHLQELCSLEAVESVEINGSGHVLDAGNF